MNKEFEWVHLIKSIGQVAWIKMMHQLKDVNQKAKNDQIKTVKS